MASNNRSWLSSSSFGSRDHEDDCHSLDSFSKEQQQGNNTSINSGNSGGMPHRTRSRGDRYNHYRRDGPSKVKPWMRDKAITGSGTSGSSSRGRFGGSSSRLRSSPMAEATSIGSNHSCGNSVSSNASLPEAPSRPLPSEVVPNTPISARSLQFDDTSCITAPEEEVRPEESSYLGMKEPFPEDIPSTEKEVSSSDVHPHDETATVDTETASTTDTTTQPVAAAAAEKIAAGDDNNTNNNGEHKNDETGVVKEDEKSEKEEATTTTTSQPPTTSDSANSVVGEPPKEEDRSHANGTQVQPASSTSLMSTTQDQDDSMEMVDDQEKENDEEFYDVLPSVQPSSYNPMAAASKGSSIGTTETNKPVSMSAYATLEKPTPLVEAQAAFLNDAIVEASDEETSFDDENESNTMNNLSADTLQGIKALDTTREESVAEEVDLEFSRLEHEKAADDLYNVWPSCVDMTTLPQITYPADWEQRQTLAAGATHSWIQSQLQHQLQGIDFKASAYSEFAAALSDCPALTTGFLASNDSNNNYCFSPCSDLMGEWRKERLGDADEFLFENVASSGNQQFTPTGLVRHCQSTMSNSDDVESRFLHGIVHTYLESLFGSSHVAFQEAASKTEPNDTTTAESQSNTHIRGDIERLYEANTELLEKLKVVENTTASRSETSQAANSSSELQELRERVTLLERANEELRDELSQSKQSAQELEHELVEKNIEAAAMAAEQESQLNCVRAEITALEASNKELEEQLKLAEETKQELAAKSVDAASTTAEQEHQLETLRAELEALQSSNTELKQKLRLAEEKGNLHEAKSIENSASATKLENDLKALEAAKSELQKELDSAAKLTKELEAKNAENSTTLEEQSGMLKSFGEDVQRLGETNAELTAKLQKAEEKHADAVASSEAQAEMMKGLCEEMKKLEESKVDLQQKLEEAEVKAKANQQKHVAASNANTDATATINTLKQEKVILEEANAMMQRNLTAAEDREKAQASREQNVTLVHVGDMPVDLRRFRVQCQKYFNKLRENQLKSHCVRDKSPVKLVLQHDPKQRDSIDIQKLLDKGAAVESQDATYLFRALDTFNKGHFHTHKLLLPWKITTTSGGFVSRSEFFAQVWQQLGSLKISVGEKKTEVPLFQESLGYLIPMPNAVLEGMLRVSPAELDRIFAAKIAPYYRAIGRLMVQCIGATADDSADYTLKIGCKVMPPILRQKLFRGVDPVDESYPLELLLDHAFSLLGMTDMTRDKAFEYFSIEAKDFNDTQSAVVRIREEVREMWLKERSLAIQALEEGLTLNGLADMSFCCGLVPLEALNEVIFTR